MTGEQPARPPAVASGDTLPDAARAQLPGALVAAALVVIALRFGGYHPRHWTWLALAAVLWWALELARGRLPGWRSVTGVAVVAGLLLVGWTAASAGWAAYSRHMVWDEANRTAMYVAVLALGATLFGRGGALSRAAVWVGSAIAGLGVVTAVRMVADDDAARLFVAGRVDWPLGYSNAVASFYATGALLMLGLSCAAWQRQAHARRVGADDEPWEQQLAGRGMVVLRERATVPVAVDAALSALTLGAATLCAALAAAAQSRGLVPALAVAVPIAFLVAPVRGALLARFATIAGLIAIAHRPIGRAYTELSAQAARGEDPAATPSRHALEAIQALGAATLLVAIAAAVAGYVLVVVAAAWRERAVRAEDPQQAAQRQRFVERGLLVLLLVAGASGAFMATGTSPDAPAGWLRQQVEACRTPQQVQQPQPGRSHYADVGTNRCDFWRVEVANFRAHPLRGIGANNFEATYVLDRRSTEDPKQAHSLLLQIPGELGLVGTLLFAIVGGCVMVAAAREALGGSLRSASAASATAVVACWFAHASVDWLWNMPAASLGPLLLAGALLGRASPWPSPHPTRTRSERLPASFVAVGVVLVAAASLLPQGAADRAYRASRDPQLVREHPDRAIAHARRAASLDRTWAIPALREAQLLAATGRHAAAAAVARQAIRREPRNWYVQQQAALVLARTDPQGAAAAARKATTLNPSLGTARNQGLEARGPR